ncbi:putative transcription factor B3-Domain family [Helianthus anomalus]
MTESSSSIREPSFCRIMNRADEVLMEIPSDVWAKLWGVYKVPTNVLIETEDGRTFIVFISEAKGMFFLFNGWSDVVTHLRFKTGCLVILNPLDSTRFKLTYFLNGVSLTCFWTSLLSTASHFNVIPEFILPKSHDYTFSDLISTIYLGNKTFHVKIETVDGKVGFTNGIDVIAVVAPIDCVQDVSPISDDLPAVAEQQDGHRIRFVRMAAEYFRLPDDVSRMAKLDLGLKIITIRLMHLSPQKEFPNGTRREKKENGYRYALTRWSRIMKTAGIKVGDTVYYCFDELEQVLSVERVVPHIRRT